MTNCPICNSCEVYQKYQLVDDRYGYPGEHNMVRCRECGHSFLDIEFSPPELESLYTQYYPRSELQLNDYKPLIRATGIKAWLGGDDSAAFRWVPENVTVLDIGCGFGESLGYHVARGCEVYGVEADSNILRVAERFGYPVRVGLFDADAYPAETFDYVTMDQVFEHVTDPLAMLKGVRRVLKQGGVAVLSLPNCRGWGARVFAKRWINWHAPYHLQHFSAESMQLAAEKAGLRVQRRNTITNSDWLQLQWLHLLQYPDRGKPSVCWRMTAAPATTPSLPVRLIAMLHRTKINHLVTRFFDALGLGDNYLFVLRKP